ncbi:MAG: malto-oligosyltrehalose trehalohydrolase [Ectothiorhodospiraceae bacterium]|nr:malto-oligosyltrehalose trehalohydrolase [Ectothiorhodospiraceae bacterium]
MEYRHSMPFGAEVQDDGSVRFQLWAPAAKRVSLLPAAGRRDLPMERLEEGWFALRTAAAGPGFRYRFLIDGRLEVADPASRFQPEGVEGPSQVVDPRSYRWRSAAWCGRSWEEAVIYELHVGSYGPGGNFDAVRRRLDHLSQLGVTALQLMPVAEVPGRWNWGYDGVLPFAPHHGYGGPAGLKRLVDEAHQRRLMVLLDVVYNHFGPQGNHLPKYAPDFLSGRHQTPWGAAINFDDEGAGPVRRFFVENALYWLEEYRLDGLRLDAVHAIIDESSPHILIALAEAVQRSAGRIRHVHLVLENDGNESRYLQRNEDGSARHYAAQWNDDLHHALHVLITGESAGYYRDYAEDPVGHLLRCLEQGFAWQGEISPYRNGRRRGESTAGLPLTAFVSFLQNHDQIGNRATGERITCLAPDQAVRAATAVLLLAPSPPLLFMGQEWGSEQPFPYFCDFDEPLATAVREGRRREFPDMLAEQLPDPTDAGTFSSAVLDWRRMQAAAGQEWLELHTGLLGLRRELIVPLLHAMHPVSGAFRRLGGRSIAAAWESEGVRFSMLANLGPNASGEIELPPGTCIYATPTLPAGGGPVTLPPWSVAWYRCQ